MLSAEAVVAPRTVALKCTVAPQVKTRRLTRRRGALVDSAAAAAVARSRPSSCCCHSSICRRPPTLLPVQVAAAVLPGSAAESTRVSTTAPDAFRTVIDATTRADTGTSARAQATPILRSTSAAGSTAAEMGTPPATPTEKRTSVRLHAAPDAAEVGEGVWLAVRDWETLWLREPLMLPELDCVRVAVGEEVDACDGLSVPVPLRVGATDPVLLLLGVALLDCVGL
jgi:hypothetical protein